MFSNLIYMPKVKNELECECGHIAGAPFTLRAHKKGHDSVKEFAKKVEKSIDDAIEKATGVVAKVKKAVTRKKAK